MDRILLNLFPDPLRIPFLPFFEPIETRKPNEFRRTFSSVKEACLPFLLNRIYGEPRRRSAVGAEFRPL